MLDQKDSNSMQMKALSALSVGERWSQDWTFPYFQNHSTLSQYAVPLFCYWLTYANHVSPKCAGLKIQGQEVEANPRWKNAQQC